MTTTTVLKTLLGTYPHTKAIKDRTVTVPGFELEFVDIEPVHDGFGAMADRLEFDVSEMAITTYILARSFDKPITGLPVVVSRNFHHRRLLYNAFSGIREPKMLCPQGIVGDPLPYGVEPNRRAIEMAAQFAFEQHVVPKLFTVAELFRPDVIRLG